MANKTRGRRGFALLDPETQRRIASQGGTAAQASGHAHRWTREEAREAGRKGGRAPDRRSTRSPATDVAPDEPDQAPAA